MAAGAVVVDTPKTAMPSRGCDWAHAIVVKSVASLKLLEVSQKLKEQFPFLRAEQRNMWQSGHAIVLREQSGAAVVSLENSRGARKKPGVLESPRGARCKKHFFSPPPRRFLLCTY